MSTLRYHLVIIVSIVIVQLFGLSAEVQAEERLDPKGSSINRLGNHGQRHRSKSAINIPNPAICIKDRTLCAFAVKIIDAHEKEFRAASSDAKNIRPPGYLKGRCTLAMDGPNILSVIFEFETYDAGAANSSRSITSLNLWKKSRSRIEYSDIFRTNVTDDLAVLLASAVFHQTHKDSDTLGMFKKTDFDNFALAPDGIVFFLNEGELAAIAEGVQKIKVPYTTLWPILKPSFCAELIKPVMALNMSPSDKERSMIVTAISTLSEILEKSPDNANAYQMRAEWYEKLGRPEVAAADRRKALELDPSQGSS